MSDISPLNLASHNGVSRDLSVPATRRAVKLSPKSTFWFEAALGETPRHRAVLAFPKDAVILRCAPRTKSRPKPNVRRYSCIAETAGIMQGQSYRLCRETHEVISNSGTPEILTIPAGGIVTVSEQASQEVGMVEVLWEDQPIKIFAFDTMRRGEPGKGGGNEVSRCTGDEHPCTRRPTCGRRPTVKGSVTSVSSGLAHGAARIPNL